jgi:hypothetical protein
MSDIKVGDLVVVVKKAECPNCDNDSFLGLIFTAREILVAHVVHCYECKHSYGHGGTIVYGEKKGFLSTRLKRIPPISELEGARDALSERNKTEA